MARKTKALIADLPRGVSVYPDGDSYRVRLGKSYTGGKTQKRRFDTIKDARAWIFGEAKEEQATIPPVVLQKAEGGTIAFELAPRQISEAAAAVKKLGDLGTLMEAVDFFIRHARPAGGQKMVSEVTEAYLSTKRAAGRSEKHLKGLKSNFKAFSEDFGKQHIHLIRRDAVEEWLEELEVAPLTKGNYIRDLKSLFEEATRRQWLTTNPLAHLQKPTIEPKEIHLLSLEEVRKLIHTAEESFPDLVPALSLKIFGGLRTSELLQLDWGKVDKLEITVGAATAKTRKRRLVTIRPNLKRWLAAYRQSNGPVFTGSQNQYHCTVEKLAAAAEILLLPNVFRHTFASYLFAILKNENLVAAEMGNTPKVVFANYRGLVKRPAALAFWKVTPKQKERKVIPFATAA